MTQIIYITLSGVGIFITLVVCYAIVGMSHDQRAKDKEEMRKRFYNDSFS